ncbi:MAG: lysylphosphatidylglycerol synthase transmembrane domain-containing protein [Stackebrandtia sp.]
MTAIVVLSRQAHYLPDSVAAMAGADVRWLATAAGLSVLSVAMFAEQQRVLLRALGTRMSVSRAHAITYAQTSVALTVPAGPTVATAFAIRHLRAAGTSVDTAVGAISLSGVASVLGLAVSYLAGAVLTGTDTPGIVQISTTVAVLALTLFVPAAIRSLPPMVVRRWRRRLANPDRRMSAPALVVRRWRRMDRSRKLGRDTFRTLLALRERDWYLAVGLAVLSRVADIASLVATARSLHVGLDARVVGVAYLAVQVGRYVSPLPGGLGVVEPTLIVILASAGVGVPAAAAVVLMYRFFSYWLVAFLGLPLWVRLNRASGSRSAAHRSRRRHHDHLIQQVDDENRRSVVIGHRTLP